MAGQRHGLRLRTLVITTVTAGVLSLAGQVLHLVDTRLRDPLDHTIQVRLHAFAWAAAVASAFAALSTAVLARALQAAQDDPADARSRRARAVAATLAAVAVLAAWLAIWYLLSVH